MFLFLAYAHADALAAPCQSGQVNATMPAPMAVGVPIDAVPAGLLVSGGCGSVNWEAELSIPATGEVIATATLATDTRAVIEVDPGGELLPDTTYRLAFTPLEGDGMASEVAFTTGSALSVGLDGGPVVTEAAASWSRDGSTVVQAGILAAPSADGDTFITLAVEEVDGDLSADVATGAEELFLTGFTNIVPAPETLCVVARQRDIAGVWTDSPSDCVATEIDPIVSCDTTSGAMSAIGVLVGLAALARRRA